MIISLLLDTFTVTDTESPTVAVVELMLTLAASAAFTGIANIPVDKIIAINIAQLVLSNFFIK